MSVVSNPELPMDSTAVDQQRPIDVESAQAQDEQPTAVSGGEKTDEGAEKNEQTTQDGEEKKAGGHKAETVSERRRSLRIRHPPPIATKAAANGSKRGAARKRSAEDVQADEHADGTEAKKKARMHKEEGIPLGSELPDLTLKNEKDEDMKLRELQGNSKGVVFFLIPKADTPGCTAQACGFRDIYSDFEQHGFKVFCVSVDATKQQAKWQTKKNLPYQLLSDPKRLFINALGAGLTRTVRSHFIFVNSKLVDKKIPVKPAESPKLALEFVISFKGEGGAPSVDAKGKEEKKVEKEEKEKEKDVPRTEERVEAKSAPEPDAPADAAAAT